MVMDGLTEYVIKGGHRRVEGWIEEGALSFLMLANHHQMNSEIQGAIAEIGVHHGRCFIALSSMRRENEFGVAADIFEDQALNPDNSGHGDHGRFISNLQTFGVADRQTVISRDSLLLTGKEVIAAAQGQQVRLFSVDGSHTAGHTANDLKIAQDALTERGVVILDDWFNPDWPGVQEGFFGFMRQRRVSLVPFAYGNSKLYLTKRESYREYFDYVAQTVKPMATHYKEVVLSGFPCHHLLLPPPDRVADAMVGATELDVADPSPSSGTLGLGWSGPEPWGRWTVGPKSVVTMVLPPGGGRDLELGAELATFFGGSRRRQIVTVSFGNDVVGEWPVESDNFERKLLAIRLPSGFTGPTVRIELGFSATQSPHSLGLSEDVRELGVRVQTLTIARRSW